MNLKIIKFIFGMIIVSLISIGTYIVYIKDNDRNTKIQTKNKEIRITKEIIIGITDFDTINPILTKNFEIDQLTKLVYEPLISISMDFRTMPALAEECSKIDDLTYMVILDNTKKWENGEPIKIEDIEFTINKIKNTDSIYKYNVKEIDRIEKIDEDKFKIYLMEPVNFFEYYLCFPIMNQETYNQEIPMGSGEYSITESNKNSIIIESKDKKIILKLFKKTAELYNSFSKGEIDIIITQNTEYEKYIGNIGFEESIIPGREFYFISCKNITSLEKRNSIKNAINKERLIYDIYNSKYAVADFPLSYGSYYNKEIIKKENLTRSLKKMNINITSEEENKDIAKKIAKQLSEKGAKVNIENNMNSKADLIIMKKTVFITPDLSYYFEEKEMNKIAKIEDEEILKKEYEKVIDQYDEEVPFISLFFNSYIILHNNKIRGDFSGNWFNIFYNINTWYKIM